MTEELIKKILISGVFYCEYGERELHHTCNLKFERTGKYEFAFCNKEHYFPERLYKKQFWIKKDKSE